MENNLYYTPTLEDLHYGFEFEYKSKDDNWIKVTLDTWNRPSKENHLDYFTEYDLLRSLNHQDMACKYEDLTCIRVKYLDREDIESLGLSGFKITEYIENSHLEFTWFKGIELFGLLTFTDKMISFYEYDYNTREYSDCIFRGTIKNLSELKKLMQQLNIC